MRGEGRSCSRCRGRVRGDGARTERTSWSLESRVPPVPNMDRGTLEPRPCKVHAFATGILRTFFKVDPTYSRALGRRERGNVRTAVKATANGEMRRRSKRTNTGCTAWCPTPERRGASPPHVERGSATGEKVSFGRYQSDPSINEQSQWAC